MSLQSWKEKFYPKPPSKRMTKRQAIEHSLLKWTGLLPKNLKKHGLVKCGRWIQEESDGTADLLIDAESCALCVKYLNNEAPRISCEKCPLFRSCLFHPCEGEGSQFASWVRKEDPRPMIRALKKTLKAHDSQQPAKLAKKVAAYKDPEIEDDDFPF